MLKISMDAVGLLQSLSSAGFVFDFSRVYSVSSWNGNANQAIEAGIYLIFFSGTSGTAYGYGNLIMNSSDSKTIYCATSYTSFRFTSPTNIQTSSGGNACSVAVSLLGIKTE